MSGLGGVAEPGMWESSRHRNREISGISMNKDPIDRSGKTTNHNPDVSVPEKSDDCIRPMTPSNKGPARAGPAEKVEERRSAERNTTQTTSDRTQRRVTESSGLFRIRQAACRDKELQFSNLLHHLTPELLEDCFHDLEAKAAPGVDGLRKEEYKVNLRDRIKDLCDRIHKGSYRAKPVRISKIPKADGSMRTLGIPCLEDKIVQSALVTILNEIYEADFKGFSYGFRPGRGTHQALDAIFVGLRRRKVNWVLDADIQDFFGSINHECLRSLLERRIADKRVLRLIYKWLRVGTLENGKRKKAEKGLPQGGVISPLLANVYLHNVFDEWLENWRTATIKGDCIAVRYADDFVVGFQYKREAERSLNCLKQRLEKYGLKMHPEKTRLIEFGRFAAQNRKERGKGKPETFDFLGFKHICSQTKKGKFFIKRKTIGKRLRAKLLYVKQVLNKKRHSDIRRQRDWLCRVINGFMNYHAIHGNLVSVKRFVRGIRRHWFHALNRRSQRKSLTWKRFGRLIRGWLPKIVVRVTCPDRSFDRRTQGRSPVR